MDLSWKFVLVASLKFKLLVVEHSSSNLFR